VAHQVEPYAAAAPLNPAPVERRNTLTPLALQKRATRVNFEAVLEHRQGQPRTPDRALIERMAAGDEHALGELYDRHGETAYALALAVVRERADADEVVADAFGQAWRTAAQYDPGRGTVAAWLATITRTRALDLVRARGRRVRAVERAAQDDADGLASPVGAAAEAPDRGLERQDARRLVTRSLAELPEPQRRVIELAYFGGLSQSEIAAELQEPLGTVKTRMRAGMDKLRGALAPLVSGGGS
jgi:RNA polymerase sigma-70 factor (ECF subfamily)